MVQAAPGSMNGHGARLKGLRAVVELALLVVLGLLLARTFWLIAAPAQSVNALTPAPASMVTVQAPASRLQANLSLLTSANPFSMVERVGAVEDEVLSVPETSLNLRLQGVRAITSGDGDLQASATIVTPDNRQGVYVVGDKLLDNVVLSRILSNRVILDKGGTYEALYLEGREDGLRVLGGEEPRQEIGGQRVVEPAIYHVASAESLLSAVRLIPAGEEALRIVPTVAPDDLAVFGLREGDRLVAVDGRPVAELDYDEVIGKLTTNNRINVSIQRGTQTSELTYVFEERVE